MYITYIPQLVIIYKLARQHQKCFLLYVYSDITSLHQQLLTLSLSLSLSLSLADVILYSFSYIVTQHANQSVNVVLVGNKADNTTDRQVPLKEGEALAASFGIHFFECSAMAGLQVNEVHITDMYMYCI